MNTTQTRYALALANLSACEALATSKYPTAPSEDASEDAWMAHYESEENADRDAGVWAARAELTNAENALVAWFLTTPVGIAKADVITAAMRFDLTTRSKTLDICFRAE